MLWWSETFSRYFYGCSRHPKCAGSLPANPDGSPRGAPRKKSLQKARNAAHTSFDTLWKEKHISRTKAYKWLQEVMGLRPEDAHMYQMTEEQCATVISMVKQKGPGTEFWDMWVRHGQKVSQGR
jgi:hypothetical protein